MPKSVEITVGDDGSVTVGLEPPDADDQGGEGTPADQGAPDSSYMQPAASIDDALQKAKALLSGGQDGQQPGAQPPDKNAMWNQVQRDRALQNQPGGPLMGQK